MRGHEPLIEMRRAGVMPNSAMLCLDPVPRVFTTNWPLDGAFGHCAATIAVDSDDVIRRLDLRFLVGLPLVWVRGHDRARVVELFEACIAAKPLRVIAMVLLETQFGPEVVEMLDSTEAIAWHN